MVRITSQEMWIYYLHHSAFSTALIMNRQRMQIIIMIQEEKEWRYVGMTFFISVALNGLASDSYTSLMYFVITGTLKFRNVYFKTNGDKGQLCNTFNPHSLSNSGPSSPKSLQNSPFQTKNVIPGKDNDWRWANIKSTCAQITPSLSFFSIDHEILIISRSMNKTSSSS